MYTVSFLCLTKLVNYNELDPLVLNMLRCNSVVQWTFLYHLVVGRWITAYKNSQKGITGLDKLAYLLSGPCLLSQINPQGFASKVGDSVIQSLKSGKTGKSGLVSTLRQEKLADLFMVFLARL